VNSKWYIQTFVNLDSSRENTRNS